MFRPNSVGTPSGAHAAGDNGHICDLTRAPVVVAVLSRVRKGHKVSEWEQILSAGAAYQTMLIAAQSMGYAAQWLTEWYAYDPDVKVAIGAAAGDEIAGYLYIGNEIADGKERARPEYDNIVLEWPAVG